MKTGATLKIGISGKRAIPPGERDRVYKEIKDRISTILRQHKASDFIGYSALATGADTIFAEVVRKEFKKHLHVILPFPIDEYEKDFHKDDLRVFRDLIGETGRHEVAATVPSDSHARNAAYYEAGKRIIDQCDETIVVWDNLKPGGAGGTAEMLGYLSEKKGRHPVQLIKIKPAKPDPLNENLLHIYHKANRLALKARNKYKRVWKWAIFLGWLTVVCFAVKTAYPLGYLYGLILTSLEFLFVVAVYVLIIVAKRLNYHGNYLEERMKAETCRLLRSFYHASVEVKISDQSKEEHPDMAEIAEKINQTLVASRANRSKWYTQYVIRSLIGEQVSYHNKKVKSIGDTNQMVERINVLIGVLFIVNLAVHLVHLFIYREQAHETWLYKLSVLFNIILPASYAALEGVMYFNEWAMLRKYSDNSRSSLKEAEKLLPENVGQLSNEECYRKQSQALHHVYRIMLTDNHNWNLLLENKDNYHLIV